MFNNILLYNFHISKRKYYVSNELNSGKNYAIEKKFFSQLCLHILCNFSTFAALKKVCIFECASNTD